MLAGGISHRFSNFRGDFVSGFLGTSIGELIIPSSDEALVNIVDTLANIFTHMQKQVSISRSEVQVGFPVVFCT